MSFSFVWTAIGLTEMLEFVGPAGVTGFDNQKSDRLRRVGRRMRKDSRSGSAIVEFALIAPVFFLLLFAIMEIGIIFFAQSTLQHATDDIGRMIRTGQVQGEQLTQAQVRTQVCTEIAPLVPCDNQLYVDVEAFSNFGSIVFSPPLDSSGNMIPLNNFQTGTACSVVLVRVFYAWPVFTPVLTSFLTTMANSKHLLYAASAFRNEPFTTGLSGC
ncbi:MAG TPA: TadE/TadG family type IV pilus assembly protein [Rhizomicrobium sp.]|nr:TadE/TadG family type IV pilus assembly protein [Rhizomicrobium sp.]